jgi:putative ABC transport system substrate-binding protein
MLGLGGAAAGWTIHPLPLTAQEREKLRKIAILDPGIPQYYEAFRAAMRDLGYVDGETIAYVYRSAEGRGDAMPALARELVAFKPDIVVTNSALPVRAVAAAAPSTPIVFAALADAASAGLVSNFAHPGGSMTGLSFLNTELSAKRVGLLVETIPAIRRIAVLRDVNTPRAWAEATEEAGHSLGLDLRMLEVDGPEAFEAAFAAAARAEALDILASVFFNAQKLRLVSLAAKYRLPTIYEHGEFAHAGGLISYGPNIAALFRRAASYVDKILKGANPGDLPVEQPTEFELVINLKTAKALGLTIPLALLARADEVIE